MQWSIKLLKLRKILLNKLQKCMLVAGCVPLNRSINQSNKSINLPSQNTTYTSDYSLYILRQDHHYETHPKEAFLMSFRATD